MKKRILGILVFSTLFGTQIFAQWGLTFQQTTGNKGDLVTVSVSARNFKDIIATQFGVAYDSLVLAFDTIVDQSVEMRSIENSSHKTAPAVKNGQLTFSWNEPNFNPVTIADGTKLFGLRFRLIGKECDSSAIRLTAGTIARIEILDKNEKEVPVDSISGIGKIKILGPNCPGSSGGNELIITGSQETTGTGGVACIKFTVKNFKSILNAQGSIRWDRNVAKYNKLQAIALNNLTYNPLADSSGLVFVWDDGTGAGLTLPDNQVIFELCLTAVGNVGASTDVNFSSNPTLLDFVDVNNNTVPVSLTAGKLTITQASKPLKIYTSLDTTAVGSEFCIKVKADGFTDMESFAFGIRIDTTKLIMKQPCVLSPNNLPNFGCGAINRVPGEDIVRVVWNIATANPYTIPTGGTLFGLCFDVQGPCPDNTTPRITAFGGTFEFEDNAGSNFNISVSDGLVTINCASAPLTVTRNSVSGEKCYKACNGAANMTTTGGRMPYAKYEWIPTTGGSSVSNVEDPTNLCPGSYRLRVTDADGKIAISDIVTISAATEILPNASITHENIGGDGAITLNPSGGIPGYTFEWVKLPGSTVLYTTQNIAGVPCGNYALKVSDSRSCVKRDTFRVDCASKVLTLDSIRVTTEIKCFGECNGSARVYVSKGTGTLTYKWDDSAGSVTNPVNNLCAGTYHVTVSDAASNSITATIVVSAPPKINLVANNILPSSGSDGAADASASGGTPSYSYVWRDSLGNVVSGASALRNAFPGPYSLCVTDGNSCIQCLEVIIPRKSNGGGNTISINPVVDNKPGGSGVTCFGVCDGKIILSPSGGATPYSYKWSHNATLNSNIADGLCSGNYKVTVTDATGSSAVSNSINISSPGKVSISLRRISCATDESTADGKYEALITGGTSPYTFSWCNGETTSTAIALEDGRCDLSVTDVNGCQSSESFVVCVTSPNAECFKGLLAISPNNDGLNDRMTISCAQDYVNYLSIFDRWGNLVFSASNYIDQFEGIDNDGNELNEGTYMWVMKVTEGSKNDVYYKGTVTIVK
ncbi:MAG: gliding motility-associated C-terminal domain-containing protein [Saprospiraceae bacterium]|jgi:gliding motility-associated-like protein|nr:gliding motility-associated C-terminal domain-containing protein [Saprospiraceae bacterium]MBK7795733.1 gliding motility-associated C-terminal domain-containing protein [Saprospiraceae bacterium]MBL0260845.1 gliding motility-associated C-terminal domain-containing protein [Saprospiraceae bacterium]